MTELLLWTAFCLLDVVAYSMAKFPERGRLLYLLPGGGFLALIVHGEDR